jgi:hypothetical protein
MEHIHKNLADGRWFQMTFCEQMGNIGSEVGRAVKRHRAGNIELRDQALARAFDLLSLTKSDPRWILRLKEVCRVGEVLADTFYGDRIYKDSPENLEKYFYQFALAARIK